MIRKSLLAPAVLAFSLWLLPFASWAQFPTAQSFPGQLQNLAILKPPPGAKVAIIVFEDLGCPHCAAEFNPGCAKHYGLYFEIA